MVEGRILRSAIAGVLLVFGCSGATAQRAETLAALQTIERGQWQLKSSNGAVRRICVTDPSLVLQLEHGSSQCQRFILENTTRTTTVRYTCAGHGNGRTTITVETPRLISVETQGVADGSPFAEQFEGRRVGTCS